MIIGNDRQYIIIGNDNKTDRALDDVQLFTARYNK